MSPHHLRRRVVAALVVPALALGLTACGSDDDEPSASTAGTGAAAATSGPLEIKHALGTTSIPSTPKRVVALGQVATDALVALGVTPVAVADAVAAPGKTMPWQAGKGLEQVTKLPGAVTGALSLEQVAAAKPDLIVGAELPNVQAVYGKLAQIAPTIGYQQGVYQDSWQETTTTVGKAVGREAQAKQLVADVEGRIAKAATDRPGLKGKTWSFYVAQTPGTLGALVDEQDAFSKLMAALGLERPEGQADLKVDKKTPGVAPVSIERVDALDADVVFGVYPAPALKTAVESDRLFGKLDAVAEKRYQALDLIQATGVRTPSVLSLPWALQEIAPTLDRVAGDQAR